MISGVKTEIAITKKYQRGTFERSRASAIKEIANMNNAIAANESVKIVAT